MTRAVAVCAASAAAVGVFTLGARLGALGVTTLATQRARQASRLAALYGAVELYEDDD